MSEECNENCSGCQEDCEENPNIKQDLREKTHPMSNVKKVIGVVSGKGGVGKSIVTSMLAVTMSRLGFKTAILDADITGPSIPKAFGIKTKATASEDGLFPVSSQLGIDIMSVNLLLPNDTDPVIWRGPIIANTVKQFWTDVIWNDIDYMFVDLPPGTGDVPLTVFQSIPVDGIVVVTSPQELVSMIVKKAVKMAEMMEIPILGIIENMSYFECPDDGNIHYIFGDSNIDETAKEHNLEVLARIPIDPRLAKACDRGMIELFEGTWFDKIANKLEPQSDPGKNKKAKGDKMIKIAVASEHTEVTDHFGHCINFNIYDGQDGKIINSESVGNPGHKPGFLPNFLNDLGVNVIISGGMGGGAVDIFNEKGIEVVVGASGDAQEVAQAYLDGNLKTTGEECNHDHD